MFRAVEFQELLNELERRRHSRIMNRLLRDINDPFFLPEEQFRKHYRLSREAARNLALEMQPFFEIGERRTKIPPINRFMAALHFFAHGSYQKSVGKDQHISISQAAVSKSIHEVVNIMVEFFTNRYIRFPRDLNEVLAVKQGFFEKFHFPGITGCIDGTFIAIVPPPGNETENPGNVFINRKNFHSLNVIIVCDANLKILSINARFPGSVHDAAVYMMSSAKISLQRRYEEGDRSTWLLGDSSYPLEPYLMTPIVGALPNTPEGSEAHKTARNCIEYCIGTIKAYFRCLRKDRVLHYSPIFAAKIIYSCAILHNILKQGNIVDDDIVIEYEEGDVVNVQEVEGNLLHQGRQIRNNIIQHHFNGHYLLFKQKYKKIN